MASCNMASASSGLLVTLNVISNTTRSSGSLTFAAKNNGGSRLIVRATEEAAATAPPPPKPAPIGPPKGCKAVLLNQAYWYNSVGYLVSVHKYRKIWYPAPTALFKKVNSANVPTNK